VSVRVISRLSSGLGNQLFQLAHGVWLAEMLAAELRFDTTWFPLVSRLHPAKRALSLRKFRIDVPEEFRGLRRWTIGSLAAIQNRFGFGGYALQRVGNLKLMQESSDEPTGYRKLASRTRLYVDGYWQTREPFTSVRHLLVPYLVPRQPLCEKAQQLINTTTAQPTGFIHVRRGDYIDYGGDKATLPLRYYKDALQLLASEGVNVYRWLVFSDDINWTRSNFSFLKVAEFVDYQSVNRDVEDLMIMKSCAAGIIANSSYSWWGAALGSVQARPIVTPDRYWRHHASLAHNWSLPHWHHVEAWS
jgi:Glycosyl transferase family 11